MTRPAASTTPAVEISDAVLLRSSGFRLAAPRFAVGQGEVAAVLGPSGAGKSTLLRALLGLADLEADLSVTGSLRVLGRMHPTLRDDAWRACLRTGIGFVPQDARAALDPLRRVGEQIAELAGGVSRADVAAALGRLGIAEPEALASRPPHRISGGQAQRALLALALLRRPRLVVLDEPTAGLDRKRILDLVEELRALRAAQPDLALLVASHVPWFVAALGATAWRIEGGTVREGAPVTVPWPARRERKASPGAVVLAGRDLGVRRGGRWIVAGADVELRAGETVALVGASGAGKTTLARLLAGHVRPDAGRIERPEAAPRRAVQLVFQDAAGSLTPHRSVRSLCREAARPGFDVAAAAAAIGLESAALERRVRELSGGQQRRAAVLRALCAEPKALLLDEPTAGLDPDTARRMVAVLGSWLEAHGAASLWITHDDDLARAVADRTLTIEEGRLC